MLAVTSDCDIALQMIESACNRPAESERFFIMSAGRVVGRRSAGYACASSARGGSGASWAQQIAGGVTAPPCQLPAGSGLNSEGPSDLFWRG